MLNWLIGLLASVSSIFTSGAVNKANVVPPLNTAIIAYQETYYAPAVADLANFPRAKEISSEAQKISVLPPTPKPSPVVVTTPPPPASAPVITPPQDPYLAIPEPITSWLSMNLTLIGSSLDSENPRTLPEITFDREYWRIEIFAYWAPDVIPPKPNIENDYFKLEIYEKGTNKPIHTITSGSSDSVHKYQFFRKAGTYYFKVYTKSPSEWEMSFTVSPKLAQ